MRRLQAVAVRAQDSEVSDSIVGPVTVHVIELERKPSIRCSLGPPAQLAMCGLEPFADQATLQCVGVRGPIRDENRDEWSREVRPEHEASIPCLPFEVAGIERESGDPAMHDIVVAAGGL